MQIPHLGRQLAIQLAQWHANVGAPSVCYRRERVASEASIYYGNDAHRIFPLTFCSGFLIIMSICFENVVI